MKILLIGHKGLLGSSFITKLPNLDITNLRFKSEPFLELIRSSNYDIVINCAVNKVSSPITNIELPLFLAESCRYLIQFSSDAVFSGKKPNYFKYSKKDIPDPICTYGKEKYEMEKALALRHNCLIIRTSFIHRSDRLVSDIRQKNKFLGFQNYLWCGLTANQIVDLTIGCIEENRTGLCHMFAKNSISKYELACHVASVYNTQTEIIPIEYPIINRQIVSDFDINFDIATLK